MNATELACGCIPLPGGGIQKPCPDGYRLLVEYQRAIEADPGNQPAWAPHWQSFCEHIGQEAWWA